MDATLACGSYIPPVLVYYILCTCTDRCWFGAAHPTLAEYGASPGTQVVHRRRFGRILVFLGQTPFFEVVTGKGINEPHRQLMV
jgi:hypothetical protein